MGAEPYQTIIFLLISIILCNNNLFQLLDFTYHMRHLLPKFSFIWDAFPLIDLYLNFEIPSLKNQVHRTQGHITRSEIPARMPLPRLYCLAPSWMQGAAASRSGRKFLSEGKYNQGWFKRESIILQKEDRLSFVPTLIIFTFA